MRKVFLRLAAAPASCLQGFAKRFPGRGVGRRVTDEVDHPDHLVALRPRGALHRVVERLGDVLGRVAAPVGVERHEVLEHLVEDNTALIQMFNAARPGGGLLVTVPQQRYLWSASDEHAMHQRRYSCAELRRKVQSAGFQIERITSFNSLLFPLMVWSRMRQKRDQDLQRWRELEISPPLNKTLESILKLERLLIEKGVSFPVGGSLLLIGRRPLSPS